MSDHVVTKKGSNLPLLNLKGKKYLMVAYRIQWMNEEVENFSINTEFLLLNENETIARATVQIMDKDGRVVKTATATKREEKKHFPDHTEKAETAAIGRAVSILGFGTQFAIADLDEGTRLADSPLEDVPKGRLSAGEMAIPGNPTKEEAKAAVEKLAEVPKKASSFRKDKPVITEAQESEWG